MAQNLTKSLQRQIDICVHVSSQSFKAGDKVTALEFHKHKKKFQTDLEFLEKQNGKTDKIPPTKSFQVSYSYQQEFKDLEVNDLEVSILNANLISKDISSIDICSWVTFDIGWPNEGGIGKGETSVVKNSNIPGISLSL
jgi:hypothetical protein